MIEPRTDPRIPQYLYIRAIGMIFRAKGALNKLQLRGLNQDDLQMIRSFDAAAPIRM